MPDALKKTAHPKGEPPLKINLFFKTVYSEVIVSNPLKDKPIQLMKNASLIGSSWMNDNKNSFE